MAYTIEDLKKQEEKVKNPRPGSSKNVQELQVAILLHIKEELGAQ